jgi:RNA polymerase sigma factor (sigma-70 family)
MGQYGEIKDDRELIQSLLNGEVGTWETFVRRHGEFIYSYCALVFPVATLEEEFLATLQRLQTDNYSLLRPFDGRAKLTTYLALKLSDLLAGRIVELFREDASRAWAAFERFFKKDILRAIAKYFPTSSPQGALDDGTTHEDLYQEICCLLFEEDYRRLRSHDRRGSFGAYVRKIVANLCMDLLRKRAGRRRLPETIARLSALEQDVFKLKHWQHCRSDEIFQLLKNERGELYPQAEIERALGRVEEVVRSGRGGASPEIKLKSLDQLQGRPNDDGEQREWQIADPDSSPEDFLMEAESERAQDQTLAVVRRLMAQLPDELQLYLKLRFYSAEPKPPREIARIMGRTEKEIYKIRQQAMSQLTAGLKSSGVKNLELSVL